MCMRRFRFSCVSILLPINSPSFRYRCLLCLYQWDLCRWILTHADYLPLIQVISNSMDTTSVIDRHYFRRNQHSHECYPRTLLDFAVWCNRLDIVNLLVSAGANINGSSGYPVRVAAHLDSTCILVFLLSAGADVDMYYVHTSGRRGSTALEVALVTRNKKAARVLIQAGAMYSDRSEHLDDFTKESYWRLINKQSM